jgi:hypothetical protein
VVHERTPGGECIDALYEITSSKDSEIVISGQHVRREPQHQTMVGEMVSEGAQSGDSDSHSDVIRSKWLL